MSVWIRPCHSCRTTHIHSRPHSLGFLCFLQAWELQVWGPPELHSKTLSEKTKTYGLGRWRCWLQKGGSLLGTLLFLVFWKAARGDVCHCTKQTISDWCTLFYDCHGMGLTDGGEAAGRTACEQRHLLCRPVAAFMAEVQDMWVVLHCAWTHDTWCALPVMGQGP